MDDRSINMDLKGCVRKFEQLEPGPWISTEFMDDKAYTDEVAKTRELVEIAIDVENQDT